MAINRGVQKARGELFLFLDSDDACVPEALERFKYHWASIPADQKQQFSAVTSLAQYPNGDLIGTKFPFNPTDSNSLEIRLKYGVKGEKWGFHRTDVLKEFPNPYFKGEKALPESLLWNRIALKYKTRYINEPLEIYYITPNSWGTNSQKIRTSSPKGTRLFYLEFIHLDYPIPKFHLLRAYANYIRFSYHAEVGTVAQLHDVPSFFCWLGAFPIGFAAFIRDKLRLLR
jgi:glycosyltransferase involved in cell wall biosynthesis